ncbi:MAG TPA: MraY family glycosyltransferase [Thermoanaerobaculia bacterium]|jgi:UDP-GlcNAc:undecaprenyl-phosphate GlcNAc-1-phosphate transferase|nr:MraY family glycosyltransferase [Thermoanaerobaculia bacterium]
MNGILPYAIGAAFVAALATNLMVPPIARLAVLFRALDHPGERKLQKGAVPRLGGVAIAMGLALGAGIAAILLWGRLGTAIGRDELLALAFGTLLVFVVGIIDDLIGVSAAKKLLVQIVAAWPLVHAGWAFEVLRLPVLGEVHLGLFGGFVSLLWIVGVTNAINLIDGLDGLAGGVVAIISVSFLAYAMLQGNAGTVILMAAVAGSCLGFLRHNWEPARVFMGDSGSLMLGFLLAATTVHSSLKAPAAVAILVPILALGVPVMDTLLVMAVRFLDRPKSALIDRFLRMFHADRKHLHHLLAHFGGERSRIVAVIYSVVLSFCALALVVAVTGEPTLGVMLVILEFSVILAMRQMGLAMEARRLSRLQREEIKAEVLALVPAVEPRIGGVRRIAR